MGEDYVRQEEAPFNMAIATLKRLDTILQQIRSLNSFSIINSVEKQDSHINLMQSFYINAVPLFEENKKKKRKEKEKEDNSLKELETEILNFCLEKKTIVKSGNQQYIHIYSSDKEKRINQIMIELLKRLEKYFMPGRREAEGLI